jgi:hypothetical protein
VLTETKPFILLDNLTATDFIIRMLEMGNPIETSLVGVFDDEGRGSRRDIPLPLHRDGDYSTNYKDRIDIVGLYCVNEGSARTLIEHDNVLLKFKLKKGQALIFDNKAVRHGREGEVKDRLLMRIWISKK